MLKKLKRVVIKEELVKLTGDFKAAIILNQFIYWIDKMRDFDIYIKEEKNRAEKHQLNVNIDKTSGWIYKTTEELNEELMINMSNATIRKYIKQLVESGWLQERRNPKYKWDKTLQYRVNLFKVQVDLHKLGHSLDGYSTLFTLDDISNVHEHIENTTIELDTTSSNEVLYISEKVSMIQRFQKYVKANKELSSEDIKIINEMNRDILVETLDECLVHNIKTFEDIHKKYLSLLKSKKTRLC